MFCALSEFLPRRGNSHLCADQVFFNRNAIYFFCCGAGGGAETLDFSTSWWARRLVAARQDFFDRRALAVAQMRVLSLDFLARLLRPQRRVLILSRTHEADIVALHLDHLFRGVEPTRLVRGAVGFDQLSRFDALIKPGADFFQRCVTHRTLQRIPHQLALVGHGFALQVLFPRICERLADAALLLFFAERFDLVRVLMGLFDHVLRLVSELARHLLMPALHFFVRDVELGAARLVRRDLRGPGAAHSLFFQVLPDFTAARTAGFDVFLRVAPDLRLSAGSLLHFIAQRFQAQGQFRAIDGRRVLLRAVKPLRLQRARLSVFSFRDVEEHHMRVELRRGVAVHGPRAVMLEPGCDPFAGCLWWMVPADPRLHVFFEFVQRNVHALTVRRAHVFISTNQSSETHALGRREGRIPAGAVFHRLYFLAALVHVLHRRAVLHQLLPGERMLAVRESRKVLLVHFAAQAPLVRKASVPLALHAVAFRVVVIARVRELLFVVRLRLTR